MLTIILMVIYFDAPKCNKEIIMSIKFPLCLLNKSVIFILFFLFTCAINCQKWQCCFYAKMHPKGNLWRNRKDMTIVQLTNNLLLQLKMEFNYAS